MPRVTNAADEGCERDVVQIMNENDGYRACGALKSMLSSRGFGRKAKKCLLLVLLLSLKPTAQAQVGKTKFFIYYFRNPTSTCVTETGANTTQGSNQRLPPPLNLSSVLVSNTVYRKSFHIEPEPEGKTYQIGTFYTLILQTKMNELQPQLECVEL